MAIIKSGFTPGAFGRRHPARLDRRVYYLAAEHGRDSVLLLGPDGTALTQQQAIELLGGAETSYQETILAPSATECTVIRQRLPADPSAEIARVGLRITRSCADGAIFVLAIHEQDGRFHYHKVLKGKIRDDLLGPHGQIQKCWDQEIFGDEPSIQNWNAHRQFKELRARLRLLFQEQRQLDQERRDCLRRESEDRRRKTGREFDRQIRDVIERRYLLELATLEARYRARGTIGSPRHLSEVERVQHRRAAAIRRLESRERKREQYLSRNVANTVLGHIQRKSQLGRVVGGSQFLAKLRSTGSASRRVIRGVSREASRTAIRVTAEAAKAIVRSSIHLGVAAAKIAAGLVAAIPTKGISLKIAAKEAGRDVAQAGQELGKGASKAGIELAKGGVRSIGAATTAVFPDDFRLIAELAVISARTAVLAARDAMTLSPVALTSTLAGGTIDAAQVSAREMGLVSRLPGPLQNVLEMGKQMPVVGSAARGAELAAGLGAKVIKYPLRPLEVER